MVLSGSRYAALIALLLPLIYAQTTEWTVYNRTIFKDGEPFIVKGVNYAPLPPGGGVTEQTQWGDLFHADWSHLHDRDLPLMRAAGVNSLRIYNIQLNYPNSDVALDHLSFFDKLWNNGVDPIYIMITYAISKPFAYLGPFNTKPDESASSYTFQTPSPDLKWFQIDDSKEAANSLEREIQSNIVNVIAERYGTHPAVLGFVIGNEQNDLRTQANCKFWEWIDSIAARVKETAPTKLTSTSIVDDDFLTVRSALKCSSLSHLDVWGINAYRGRVDVGFDRLFTTHAALTEQALLITEYGCPASTRDQGEFVMMPMNSQDQGKYLKVHWDDMMAHGDICSGGYAFSWVDEWWKIGDWGVQNRDDARNYAFPGTYADEEAFGLLAVEVDCDSLGEWQTRKDNVIPRAAYYYMALMFGVYDEIPDVAFEPITYPLCDGTWISNGTNPDIGIPVAQQGPVSHVPLTSPPPRPVPTPAPVAAPIVTPSVAAPVTQQTPQPVVVPPVTVDTPHATPVSAAIPVRDTPSTVATPVSGTNNNIVSSSTALVASSSLIVAAFIALL